MEITNIPLNPLVSSDERIWHFSENGCNTVKSGYRLLMKNITKHAQEHHQEGDWANLWKILTPPKIRSFLWRAAHGFLLCRLNLQSRNIQVPSCYVICESGLENNWHVFIDCPYAKECWKVAKLDSVVSTCAREAGSFPKWLFEDLEKCPKPAQPNFSAVLWSIWRYRNEKLWNGAIRPPQITVSLGYDMLINWQKAQQKIQQGHASISRRDEDGRWAKPPDPSMKYNVDAAQFKESQAISFGAVIRDSAGTFMVSKTSVKHGLFEVKEAEALILLDAIQWTASLEIHDIIFETDSKMVVNTITSKNIDHMEFGSIISSCYQTIDAHPSFKIQHVRRQANMAAHTLARAAISYANPFITYHSSEIICNFIHHDCVD